MNFTHTSQHIPSLFFKIILHFFLLTTPLTISCNLSDPLTPSLSLSLYLSMDSLTRLDYALFQLTPTRTRFDLVLFCRGNSEKLASGLFEPFISHLKFARDEISKGGYSINLRPPTHAAPWFTKATFERFVRFVSTPPVLERFVSIEKEILQIEVSIQANELSTTNVSGQIEQGSMSFTDGDTRKSMDESVQEENSKIQLQRLLETRRTLLRKEQAMAFARAVVAGFEKENIDDLISFADAYGAARLREACINFKELCKKKRGDGLWMEELAAMEACSPSDLSFMGTSGIVLTNETSAPNQNVLLNFTKFDVPLDGSKSDSTASSDGKKDDNSPGQVPSATPKVQVPVWPNQLPHYMYGFQGPIQQLPPYRGYSFPPMQPHYAANMQWPPNMNEAYHRKKSSLGKKEKYVNRKDPENSGDDTQTESSDSDPGSNTDSNIQEEKRCSSAEHPHGKKHKKKSSRTVVIRNINYITPKRRNGENDGDSDESSSGEDEFIDGDSIKKKVDDVVGLLKKSQKSNSSCHKQKGANKSLHVANGSNGSTDPDFDDDSIADASKKGKGNENWDAFQNLLIRDEEETPKGVEKLHHMDAHDDQITIRISEGGFSSSTSPAVDLGSEKVPEQPMIATDSFVVTERGGGSEGRVKSEDFENGENFHSVLKRLDCTYEELLFLRRSEAGNEAGGLQSTLAADSSITKTAKGEDWFIANNSTKLNCQNATNGQTIFDGDRKLPVGDQIHTEKHRKDLIDDSFMVQARSATDDLYDSRWRTDISMVADLTSAANPGNGNANVSEDNQEAYEPDDLYMVLERESEFQSAKDSWNVDFGIDETLVEVVKRSPVAEDTKLTSNGEATIKNNVANGSKGQGKDARSKISRGSNWKAKPELISKSRKPSLVSRPTVQKSKLEKEEEMRKKMEDLSIQRQKRIAERTAASGLASPASKKGLSESKTAKSSIENKTHSTAREMNRIGSQKIRAT